MRTVLPDREARSFVLRLALGLAAIALLIPSRFVHGDAYDELAGYELSRPVIVSRHPLAEPALWALTHALRALHLAERSLRPTQLWSAAWTIVALGLVYVYAHRRTRSTTIAAGSTLLLAACHVTLFWLRDPFLPYWPASVALATAMLVVGTRDDSQPTAKRLALVVLLGALAALFNPMLVPTIVAVAVVVTLATGGAVPRAVGLAWFAVAPLSLVLLSIPADPGGYGVYGVWRRHAFGTATVALSRSVIAESTSGSSWLAVVAWVVMGSLVVLAVRLSAKSSRWRLGLPLLAASVVHAIFVAYWDPEQTHFWLLVPWLWVLAWLTSLEPGTEPGTWLGRIAKLAIALLAIQNGLSYVWPTSSGKELALARAERARTAFGSADLLVFPEWPDLALGYWAALETTGWVSLFADRRPGETTFRVFERTLEGARQRGGRVFLDTDESGAPLLPKEPNVGVSRAELDRLVLGSTQLLGADRLREVRAVLDVPVCSSRARALPLGPGLAVLASGFAEEDSSRTYAPERAFDERRDTEWLAPGELGWLELYFAPARDLSALDMVNAQNEPYRDFATRVATVTIRDEAGIGREARATFARATTRVRLDADRVACLRVLVLEHAGRGGGFAELGLIPANPP